MAQFRAQPTMSEGGSQLSVATWSPCFLLADGSRQPPGDVTSVFSGPSFFSEGGLSKRMFSPPGLCDNCSTPIHQILNWRQRGTTTAVGSLSAFLCFLYISKEFLKIKKSQLKQRVSMGKAAVCFSRVCCRVLLDLGCTPPPEASHHLHCLLSYRPES